ncbi:MAG TPA: tetratricopeptide repeat protein [candidate division Zixibacteria bacterium]
MPGTSNPIICRAALLLTAAICVVSAEVSPAQEERPVIVDTIRITPGENGINIRRLLERESRRGESSSPGHVQGEMLIQSGQFEQAVDVLEPLWLADPTDEAVAGSLKRAYRGLKNYAGLQSVLRRQLDDSPGDVILLSEMADAFFAGGTEDSARHVIDRMIAADREDPERRAAAARCYARSGDYIQAMAVYRQSRIDLGDSLIFAEDLSRLLEARREYAAAVDEYFRWLEAQPGASRIVQKQLTNLIKMPEAAGEITASLERIVRGAPDNEYARRLYGDLLFESGRVDSAFAEYRRADLLSAEPGMHRIFGIERALEVKNYVAARREATLFLADYPEHRERTRVSMTLANSELKIGRPNIAIDLLRTLAGQIQLPRERGRVYYEIGEIFRLHMGALDSSETYYFRMLEATPGRAGDQCLAWMRLGDLAVMRGELTDADSAYSQAAQSPPTNIAEEIAYKRAELLFLSGNIDESTTKLTELVKSFPRGLYVNDALGLSMILREGNDAMGWSLKQYAAARLEVRRMRPDSAIALFETLAADSANQLADDALLEQASVFGATSRFLEAVGACERLIELFPDSPLRPRAWVRIGNLYADSLGNASEARAAYQLILSEYKDSPVVEEARRRLQTMGVP